jgi:hypothetical protein
MGKRYPDVVVTGSQVEPARDAWRPQSQIVRNGFRRMYGRLMSHHDRVRKLKSSGLKSREMRVRIPSDAFSLLRSRNEPSRVRRDSMASLAA